MNTSPADILPSGLLGTALGGGGLGGSWGQGTSTVIDVMGFNYIGQGYTDAQHAKFPN